MPKKLTLREERDKYKKACIKMLKLFDNVRGEFPEGWTCEEVKHCYRANLIDELGLSEHGAEDKFCKEFTNEDD